MQIFRNLTGSPPPAEARLAADRERRARWATQKPATWLGSAPAPRLGRALLDSTLARSPIRLKAPVGAFRALILHDIADENRANFARLVQFLDARQGILAPDEIASPPAKRAGHGAPCLLTFDDGFLSQYRLAREILDPCGAKAVFFICPALIDLAERNDYSAIAQSLGYSAEQRIGPLMRWREVRALADNGHKIGAHSRSHRCLVDLPREILEDEVLLCAERLERAVAAPVDWFAYPFGNIRNIDERALRCVASRYAYCYSGVRGLNLASTPPLAMLREHLQMNAPFPYLRLVLDGALDWRYLAARRRLRRMVGAALEPAHEIRD